MLKSILTHDGSGLNVVQDVCRELGARLHVVSTLQEARHLPFDGVLLLGGCDITPSLYGQATTYSQKGSKWRDAIEWSLARRAIAKRKPIMGICRGHQFLTVACGGSLYQDVFFERKNTKIAHNRTMHALVKVKKPLMAHIPTINVNSYHHQAVYRLPFGFSVLARSTDGVIESIYRPGYLGVQFHPEYMVMEDDRWMTLFQWFIKDRLR